MASYIPAQKKEATWNGEWGTPQFRPNVNHPARRAGTGGSFDRGWGGDKEARLDGLGRSVDRALNTVGNIILYRGIKGAVDEVDKDVKGLGDPSQHKGAKKVANKALGTSGSFGAVGPGGPAKPFGELMPGPPVRPMGDGKPKPLGPGPSSGSPRTATFDPRRPGANLGRVDLPAQGPAGQLSFDFGQRKGFQPDLSPNMSQPTPPRRPAGMDPRKRGTWARVDRI
jgi:hypothetical protein